MSAGSGRLRRVLLRSGRILGFLGYFTIRLILASLLVAREIVTPGTRLCPAIVRVPLRARTRTEIVLVALAVGLTPGTLTVAVRRHPAALYVHGMYAADPVAFRGDLAELEQWLLLALRPVGAAPAPARSRRR